MQTEDVEEEEEERAVQMYVQLFGLAQRER